MSFRRRLSFTLLMILLVLSALEVGFRSLAPSVSAPNSQMPGNPYLLWELPRGSHVIFGTRVYVNALGMRGPDVKIPKPPGTRRFLTTGDSSVFGVDVRTEYTFPVVAARLLGNPIEGMNGGVPGYSSLQSLNMLQLRGLTAQPDLIVVANLWSDNNFDSFVDEDLLANYASKLSRVSCFLRQSLEPSALFRALHLAIFPKSSVKQARSVRWGLLGQNSLSGHRRIPVNEYAAYLEQFVQLARKHEAEVVFLMLPNRIDLQAETRPWSWDIYRRAMRDTARRHGAPLIDLPQLFKRSGRTANELFNDEMHPSIDGHRLIGEALARLLRSARWPEGHSIMGRPDGSDKVAYIDPFVEGAPEYPHQSKGSKPNPAGTKLPSIAGVMNVISPVEHAPIQLEAVDENGQILDTVQLPRPAAFSLVTGEAERVWLRARVCADIHRRQSSEGYVEFKGTMLEPAKRPAWGLKINIGSTCTIRRGPIRGQPDPEVEAATQCEPCVRDAQPHHRSR